MVPVVRRAIDRERRLREVRLLLPLAVAVWLISERAAVVAVDAHLTVAVIAVGRHVGRIDRDARVVHAEAIALRVAVREEPPLQHLVRRDPDAGDDAPVSYTHLTLP